tara:strand:- start:7907 stop:10453 length:2547 start_codon:yes stop_codon:yes gene_type:complete
MSDYEPIDLSSWCNSGIEILENNKNVNLGAQTMRGLPFAVGSPQNPSKDRCYISIDSSDSNLTIPINKTAQRVIFAHRLLESQLLIGGYPGNKVAKYVFHMTDGTSQQAVIRERFEIGILPPETGNYGSVTHQMARNQMALIGHPYLAVYDKSEELFPRHDGPWHLTGRRQTEAMPAEPREYYLWSWENQRPSTSIKSIDIIPTGPKFLIAAITLGNLDEHPFAREARRPVKITLPNRDDSDKSFNVDVDVDRGDSTYANPLPSTGNYDNLSDSIKGWGQEKSTKSNPSYVEIGATPSATVTVNEDGKKLGSVNWGKVEKEGSAEDNGVRLELLDTGKNWVHVTVIDEDTGMPVPCRVHFRSPEGVPYQPHGHHNQVNSNLDTWHIDVGGDVRLGQITYAYIDGKCQGWLPRGEVIVDVARGFEYEPLRTKINIEPGQQNLTLNLKRWSNMNSQGWYSGDSHVHFLSTQGSHTESQGEDLNVVNLLQSQWGSLFTNTEDFTGAPSIMRDGNNIVYVGQENRQHFLGHMILWGLKEPIMPWCSDGLSEGELAGAMETTLSHWADEAHAQGGYVINPHFPNPNGEPAALIATNRLDGIEMLRQGVWEHQQYYGYLNCGYRLPLVGGTDKMSSDVPVGLYRTYVKIPEDQEFNYETWCQNVAKGRTFLSGGPIIHFSVDGLEIGDTLKLSGPGTIEVEAWAESIIPINTLEIVQGGRVIASSESIEPTRRLHIKDKFKIQGNTWLAARCGGPEYLGTTHYDEWRRGVFAHTSPIYVATDKKWEMFDEAMAKYMLTMIEGDLEYIRHSSRQNTINNVTHHHGEKDHQKYLERPLLEAQSAIHDRLHRYGISH